jgi:general nucleoside transport system ATP-binding protein
MEPAARTDPRPFITLEHISKQLGSVLANRDISLDFFEGEVHAIIGENGAGKSTLMRILNGELQPDAGNILLNGRRVTFPRPQDAMAAGIGLAHQSFLIFPQLTALENVIVGCEPSVRGWIRRKPARDELRGLCRSVGFDLPFDSPAGTLSFAHRQQIEILRLLYRKVNVLILDEPTSLLAPPETDRFLDLLRSLQATGHTILFISHRLHEVVAIADRVSVLSRGKIVGSLLRSEITLDRLVQLVVTGGNDSSPLTVSREANELTNEIQFQTSGLTGKKKQLNAATHHLATTSSTPYPSLLTPHSSATPFLELREVTTRPGSQESGLKGFSLEIYQGEVFGLGGVVGNGQRTLAFLLAGVLPAEQGTVMLAGRDFTRLSLSERMARGLRWLPANPLEEALLPARSLWENLLLGRQRHPSCQHHNWLNRKAIQCWAAAQLDQNEVVYARASDPLHGLSGGNAQKLALSRVLVGLPRLVILEQPSRGLDLQAQEHLRGQIRNLNEQGVTFLLISYDLDELLRLSHRLGVLYRGRLMGVAEPREASRELLGSWMLGVESGNLRLEA